MLDLAVVIPVYNEEACIQHVLKTWLNTLSSLKIQYKIFIFNDGSQDQTLEVLNQFQNNHNIYITHQANRGHGPTILTGYHMVVDTALWVFQIDADNEIESDYFSTLWRNRNDYDALLGIRMRPHQKALRRLISACSRLATYILFGSGIKDVNVPYRLMRSSILKDMLENIPSETFAPNVLISGLISFNRLRIFQMPVVFESRKTGRISLHRWKLWNAALRSFVEMLQFRLSYKKKRLLPQTI